MKKNILIKGCIIAIISLLIIPNINLSKSSETKQINNVETLSRGCWSDNFDKYTNNQFLDGGANDGGWTGWDGDSAKGAYVRDDKAQSTPYSVEISGTTDLVHEFIYDNSDNCTFVVWQYVPSNMTGTQVFILMNTYIAGATHNNQDWSLELEFSASGGYIRDYVNSGEMLPLITNQWVEIRVQIDFLNDIQTIYYGGNLLTSKSWKNGVSPGGARNLACVDLYAGYPPSSAVYYDDMYIDCVTPVSKKFEQMPDIKDTGIDINVDRVSSPYYARLVADDFNCTSAGRITNITIWGSYFFDDKYDISLLHMTIYSDIPASQSPTGYSMPGNILWERTFLQGEFKESVYLDGVSEWWYDPYRDWVIPNSDHNIYQYDFNIPWSQAFIQNGTPSHPVTYWLGINANSTNGTFGWKTSFQHWNDDATYNIPEAPFWNESIYPAGHPYEGQSIDMSFRIMTTTTPECCFEASMSEKCKLGVQIYVKNICDHDVTNVPWNITVTGKHVFVGGYKAGTIGNLASASGTTLKSFVFGFGKITITLVIDDCPPFKWEANLILFLVCKAHPIPILNYEYSGCGCLK